MTPRDRSLIEDILDDARIAIGALAGLSDAQVAEVAPFYTATHALMIVGEAASKVSAEVRAKAPDLPWRQIVDTRNLIVHAYNKVEPLIVAEIVRDHLPELIARLERLLKDDPE